MNPASFRIFLVAAAAFGFLGVALGAFGAHLLRERFGPEEMARFETAVRYQFYHVFALVAVALLARDLPHADFRPAGWAFIAGIVLFSGSLYMIDLTGMRWFGAVTPFGGILLLAGWALLAWEGWKAF